MYIDAAASAPLVANDRRPLWTFFALACAITWLFDLPAAWSAWVGREVPAYALLLTGLGAFGPTLAALAVAGRRRELGSVFGRWRTHVLWVVVGLAAPVALHTVANCVEVALGGRPAQWFYPPVRPEHFAALLFFSVGEEFGWRGYAHPIASDRYGAVRGALLIGVIWAIWHLLMNIAASGSLPSALGLGREVVELSLWSVVIAWLFERGGRSMAVAIAAHAGAHLDNVARAPSGETRLIVLRLGVLAVAALCAGLALRREAGGRCSPAPSSGA